MNSAKLFISCTFSYLSIIENTGGEQLFLDSVLCIAQYSCTLCKIKSCPDMTGAIFYLTKICGCAGHLIHQDALRFYK
jgi:hypothetical protein